MSKMNQATLAHILAPIFSVLCFVMIVTINPTTVTGDLGTKEITTVAAVPATAAKVPTPPAPTAAPAEVKLQPSPAAQPAPAKTSSSTVSVSKAQPQPSRSTATPVKTTASQPAPSTSTSSSKATAIIATGKQYLGIPYVYGGTTPSGFDCSGFVQFVFAKNGITLPRVSRDQYKVGSAVSYNNLQPGDLVFFSIAKNGVVDHVGIYVGSGQFINAASSKGVAIYTFGSYWQSVYLGARRVI